MSKLESIYPKDNFYLTYIYGLSLLMCVFGLSWIDVGIVLFIDTLAFFIIRPIDIRLFYWTHREYQKLQNYEELVEEARGSLDLQNKIFAKLSSFPEKRCLLLYFTSLTKVIPAGLYISYVSKSMPTMWENFLLFYIADTLVLIYALGLQFIQLHLMTSEMMGELKAKEGWKETYRDIKLQNVKDRFSWIQNFILITMLINILFVALYTRKISSVTTLQYVIYFSVAVFCIATLQWRFQQFFRDSLQKIFKSLSVDFMSNNLEVVSLHTSPVLANFEYAFNQLGMKLEEREKEISQWLKHESEQFHLRSLGEVTAMVAHDMKTPLSVMSMSLDMMNDEKTSEEDKKKYQKILEANLGQSLSFSKTLMAYVRGSKEDIDCSFGDIHQYLLDLFKAQFLQDELNSIKFNLSDGLNNLRLKNSRLDLMHTFYNIYQNSIKATLNNKAEEMVISLWCDISEVDNQVSIFIHDSGEGLPVETFQCLISFERFKNDGQFYNGLGLRLTHTILGRLGGSLDIVPVRVGTCLKVVLPLSDEKLWNPMRVQNSVENSIQ